MGKCTICFKEIINIGNHLHFCKARKEKYGDIDSSMVKELYNNGKSPYEIADLLKINRHQIYRLFEWWDIQIRSIKEKMF